MTTEPHHTKSFYNHPCTIWARESQENYEWLLDHAYAMCQEYTRRYGKVHKSIHAIEWCGKNYHKLSLPRTGLTPFAQAMPEEYKTIVLLQHIVLTTMARKQDSLLGKLEKLLHGLTKMICKQSKCKYPVTCSHNNDCMEHLVLKANSNRNSMSKGYTNEEVKKVARVG